MGNPFRRQARAATAAKPIADPVRCAACSSAHPSPQEGGWIERAHRTGDHIRYRVARCGCLHRAILGRSGETGRVPCAQDLWGAGITQAICNAERDRLMAALYPVPADSRFVERGRVVGPEPEKSPAEHIGAIMGRVVAVDAAGRPLRREEEPCALL